MIDDMGIFRTTIAIAALHDVKRTVEIRDVMVDTGAEYNWIPRALLEEIGVTVDRVERFETADGRVLQRDTGWAVLYAAGRGTPTIVVFSEPGDMVLLGAFGLEGLNMRIDMVRRELVPAGPVPAAAAA